VNFIENDPDHILAALDDEPRGWATPQVHLVNVNTGKRKRVLKNTRGVHHWIADQDGQIRIGTKIDTKFERQNVTIYYRETESSNWETLQRVDYFDHDRLSPYRFDETDPSILLVTSANLQDEQDPNEIENQLFRYDLNVRRVIGPHKDTHRKNVIKAVEKALPDVKVKIVSRDKDKNTYFFRVYSDVKAPEYFVFDIEKRTLDYVASQYPGLIDCELAPMERIMYKARDGLEIPAFLTIPVGAERENLPVVVYPHGGPWARDRWGFDNYVQFMANRGYAVFQPQFRGSTGYGIEHEEAGYGEWGAGIQDDITDGVEWLIEEGIVDPDRICIVGSSFGGYAAAMGAAKTPNLYRCVVSINGVLDLKMMIDSGRYLLFETINRTIWNDRADAESASPYHLASNITAPMLLIGSERDTIVPVKHSIRMHKKMRRLDKTVTYIELPDGEHWRTNEANEIIKFEALENFLAAQIGSERAIKPAGH
jgi:dipeptidyl aminopeptidase/acylaminoacyl peptidase